MRSLLSSILISTLLLCCGNVSRALAREPSPDRPDFLRVNMQEDTPDVGDFIVGPPRVFVSLPPGGEKTVEIEITNREGSLAAFDLSTEDFASNPLQGGLPTFYQASEAGPYPARLWIEPEVRRLELRHGERAFLRVTVRAPDNASAGDHQAALIVTRDTESQPVAGFNIVSRVAALFIITVEGDIVQDGSVDALESAKRIFWFLPATMRLKVSNRGTVHMIPTGSIDVRNVFGIPVDAVPVRNWTILRESVRTQPFDWRPRFALGYYRASTTLTAFGGRELPPVSTTFWVIPIVPVMVLLLLIFFVSLLVQLFFSRFELRRKSNGKDQDG